MTCWRRLAEWAVAGVWPRLHEVLLAELRGANALDFSLRMSSSSRSASAPSSRRAVLTGFFVVGTRWMMMLLTCWLPDTSISRSLI